MDDQAICHVLLQMNLARSVKANGLQSRDFRT